MYKIFQNHCYQNYGVWLKDEKENVILIAKDELKYSKDFLKMHLINAGVKKIDAIQIIKLLCEKGIL